MKIIIDYEGNQYISEETEELTAEEMVDALYSEIERANKFKLRLETGEYLILGPEAIKRCAIIVVE
ncbi:hypothetical protein M316_0139 [Nitrincola phage 1M3-16]|uniref:hypothetical protein n=1 Tax=Nitrincola phage 1M3-16 TaxID=1472912 RepID=UPI000444E18F|nr:hypothetical protein GJ22_gp013 [Nitrincola phage 1M3-16]AHX01204.1 hypothetical protein M316_0139 [Nitrincola phage 1M3-16]